jgi:hypothetical protein
MPSYLSADDFLAAATGQTVDFDAPGLGVVKLRSLTVLEFSDITRSNDPGRVMVQTVAKGMVEPAISYDDLMAMRAGVIKLLDPIAGRIAELSALGDGETLENFPGGGS